MNYLHQDLRGKPMSLELPNKPDWSKRPIVPTGKKMTITFEFGEPIHDRQYSTVSDEGIQSVNDMRALFHQVKDYVDELELILTHLANKEEK